MADYFVASGGSNTAPYDTWAKAATSLQTALTAATATGDRVILQYNGVPSGDAEVSVDTTYTFGGNVSLICASADDANTAFTPTKMGTANWVGNSTTNRSITLAGAFAVYVYGLTVRTAGSSADDIIASGTAGSDYTLEGCYLWSGNTNTGSRIVFGSSTGTNECAVSLIDTEIRFGATAQGLNPRAVRLKCAGVSISASGSTPTYLIPSIDGLNHALEFDGCDLSNCGTALFNNNTGGHRTAVLRQCKIPATLVAAQTTYGNKSQIEVLALDCSDGDNHYQMIYNNGIGELIVDTGVYITSDGAAYNAANARASWKITTTANASFANPFITPWIAVHNESTSLTPYVEALRKGSTTKYKESELWSDWMYKDTANVTTGSIDRSDRGGIKASTTDQAASSLTAADWTGEDATNNAFMKLSPGTITPTEIGDLCVRICVGKASVTDIYIDPKIRT